MYREDGRFDAEAEKADQENGLYPSLNLNTGQIAAEDKMPCLTVDRDDNDSGKTHGGTAEKIGRVHTGRIHALMVLIMRDKRNCREAQHFKEEKHGEHVG